MTTDQNHKPAHMRNTGAWPTKPLREALRARGHDVPEPALKPASPHVVADDTKANDWPVQDPQPTKPLRVATPKSEPHPHPRPNVVVEPAMTRRDIRLMEKLVAVGLWVVLAVVAVAIVAAIVVEAAS
jgi:hypothetical protein